jgi:adenylate cyclase
LEQRYAGQLADYYGLLAHHYRLSDQRDKAVDYLLKAGDAASAIYANDEAEQSYRWALEALDEPTDPRSWQAHDALGDVLATVGRYEDAIAQHDAVLQHVTTPDIRRRALRKRGSVLERQGRYAEARATLEEALMLAQSGAPGIDRLAVPLVTADLGLVHQRRGAYDDAIDVCELGLRHLFHDQRSRDDELIEARLHSTLGAIYGMRGDYPRAQHHFERSLRAREAIDDLAGIVVSNNNLGYLWQLQSEYERAIGHYQVAETTARRINLRYALIFSALNTAYALLSLGRYVAAAARCGDALLLAQALNDRQNIAQSHLTLGMVLAHLGDDRAALQAFQQALTINQELASAYQEANCLIHIAAVYSAQGRYAEARTVSSDARARAEQLNAQRLKAEAECELAEAAIGLGEPHVARTHAEAASELARAIGSSFDGGVAHRLLGIALAAIGAQYAFDFAESIALLERTNDRYELACTWAAYGKILLNAGNEIDGAAYLKQAAATFKELGAAGELRRLNADAERNR